ncbi:MAG: YciI family protein [bacterium]
MNKRFAYFYFMKPEPDKIRQLVPAHVEYWRKCSLTNYSGGPFADRSGGLITFEATNLDETKKIVINDPFVLNDVLESNWIKEWVVEE